jgi:hypothetical protein
MPVTNVYNMYVDEITTDGGTTVPSALTSNIDSKEEGVNIGGTPYIAAISPALLTGLGGSEAGSNDAEISASGTKTDGSPDESSFEATLWSDLRANRINWGPDWSTSGSPILNIPNDTDNVATVDAVIHGVIFPPPGPPGTEPNPHIIVKGESSDAVAVTTVEITGGILPPDGSDADFLTILPRAGQIRMLTDPDLEKHDTLLMQNTNFAGGALFVLTQNGDPCGDPPWAPGTLFATLEDCGVEPDGFYLPPESGTVGLQDDTPFPGASVDIDNNTLELRLDPDQITSDMDEGVYKVSGPGGSAAQFNVKIRALQSTVLANMFAPIPGNDETPVTLNFADQNGALIRPLTLTAGAAVPPVGSYDVELEAEDGTFTGIGADTTVTTLVPRRTFAVKPNSGKDVMTITADADPGEATLTLDFANVDVTQPVIGTATAVDSGFDIPITDDQGVNLADTTVIVQSSTGVDITAQLERTDVESSATTSVPAQAATSGTIQMRDPDCDVLPDNVTVIINARDQAGNETGNESRTVNVTTCSGLAAECVDVDPAFGNSGETLDITITGSGTSFSDSSTVSFSCTGITVNSVTASSGTELVANITIADDANAAICNVTADGATCSGAFQIITGQVSCSVSPSSGDAGEDLTVTLTIGNIPIDETTTVSFDCSGITVNTVRPVSDTQVEVDISIAEDAAQCTDEIIIGNISCGSFTVNSAAPECELTSSSPASVRAPVLLPRIVILTVNGAQDFATNARVDVAGGPNVLVTLPNIVNRDTVRAIVVVPRGTAPDDYDISVTSGSDICTGVSLTVQ